MTGSPLRLVTTSWDDGFPSDLRLAGLLARYGMPATFYIPIKNSERAVLPLTALQDLQQLGMEIGGHTYNHVEIARLPERVMLRELTESKQELENLLGRQITSFCYPRGKFSRAAAEAVCKTGFRLGRTTCAFRTDTDFDPFYMPTSLQFFSHGASTHLRHALGEYNWRGLARWAMRLGVKTHWESLLMMMFGQVAEYGGVFHFWGHSWELDEFGLWDALESFLKKISRHPGIRYVTNSEALAAAGQYKNQGISHR